MNFRNVFTLSFIGSLLTIGAIAAVIVNPLLWCPTVVIGMYVPEALSEID